ncbi:acyl-CoA dehydrogenase family protein [Brevibacterium daeguense]|uniref:Acyl-CoA dehydrogenase family protein n=1 Tax=Brevibacterium daeguense TaxID=909936 RepID=A0ABP8EFN2_9MICO|nr:acyl-CoA dehydrogenase family protein [Brevibacterium daeguense]
MDFRIPEKLQNLLNDLDAFIEREIRPLEQQDDNIRFFDHRREWARTDWDNGGVPHPDWEALLSEAKRRADKAGFYRAQLPEHLGGMGLGNLDMAVIRDHFASQGLGLHNDLQNEHSVVGNNVGLMLLMNYGSDAQIAEWKEKVGAGEAHFGFGITEPNHGSDATHMDTKATKTDTGWVINGEKMWNSGVHTADCDIVFARTHGEAGDAEGITAFLVPMDAPGVEVLEYVWTFNMPTDHAHVRFSNVEVDESHVFGEFGRGLAIVQHFFNENRIRQAASSLGAAQYCIDQSVQYAKERKPFGKPLAVNQGIQFPLVDLQARASMLRSFVRETAWLMDQDGAFSVSDRVSMANYQGNRLACDAADQAMQVHGGMGYSRKKPFEHIYRHHRRYRITEGSDEIQMRRVAGYMFGFMSQRAPKGVSSASYKTQSQAVSQGQA